MEMDDHQAELLRTMMKNSATPSPVFEALAGANPATLKEHVHATMAEARHPGTTRERLHELGSSADPVIREVVASRPDCPLGLLIQFATDDSHEVRRALARNPAALPVIDQLATDRHRDVLKALIANPALPRATLLSLASHKRRDVRNAALERLRDIERVQQAPHTPTAPELRDGSRPPYL